MPRLAILTDKEQTEFDYPPTLPANVKAISFAITKELEEKINRLRTPTNQVGFLIQYAYFKACKRFFVINRFKQEDIEYAARLLGIDAQKINFAFYRKKVPSDHQDVILKLLNYKAFDENGYRWLKKQTQLRVKEFIAPRQLFSDLLLLLQDHCIALPSSHRLIELITDCYLKHEKTLLNIVKKKITRKMVTTLDRLLSAEKSGSRGTLSQLKIINQSIKPKAIQASLNLFSKIEELFIILQPIIEELDLTPNSCTYYATWVEKSRLSQIKQFPNRNKIYLHLIAFIQHQYCL